MINRALLAASLLLLAACEAQSDQPDNFCEQVNSKREICPMVKVNCMQVLESTPGPVLEKMKACQNVTVPDIKVPVTDPDITHVVCCI